MRKLAVCVLAAFVGWAGLAAALDVSELQAKLAAQEAALNDMEAKLSSDNGDAPEYMMSINKNAKVAIGGLLTTGYFYQNGGGDYIDADDGKVRREIDAGDFSMSDNELNVSVEVNEHFDAYLNLDLHAADDKRGIAQSAWVRWKNIRDTGFGLKVGRDDLVFGDGDAAVGYLYNFTNNDGDGVSWWWDYEKNGDLIPHNGWDNGGVTQIAPYWELMDGKLLLEASLFAHMWNDEGAKQDGASTLITYDGNSVHSRNYGLGSGSLRATWNPAENLHFSASVVNYHANGIEGWDADEELAKNNTAVALSFSWRPACYDSFNVWAQYVHGWNVNHYAGVNSDAVNYGVSYDFTDSLTAFAQGDSIHGEYAAANEKYRGWAAYAGVMYDFGNGLSVEAGWRHESIKRYDDGTDERMKTDTVYTTVGFEF